MSFDTLTPQERAATRALMREIRVLAPVIDITVDRTTSPPTATVTFDPSATGPQQTAVAALLAGYDWGVADTTALNLGRQRADAKAYLLTDPLPTNKLIRAVVLLMLDEINILRNAAGLAPRTIAQLRTAIQNKIDAGSAD